MSNASSDVSARDWSRKIRPHSLAWRLIIPVFLALAAATALAWFVIPRITTDNAVDAAVATSWQIADQFKVVRDYYTKSVVAKVVKQGALKPAVDHKDDPNAIPLPATMIHDLGDLLAAKDMSVKLYSKYPFPNRKDRQLDAFEQQAWDYLSANPKATFSRLEERNGEHVVRAAVADVMVLPGCVNCHNATAGSPKTDWKLGDVRGVLEVDTRVDRQMAAGASLGNSIIMGTAAVALLLLGILLLATRGAVGPLGGLVAQMKKLAAGNFDVKLPGLERKDEIGDIAQAVEVFRRNGMEVERMRADRSERETQAVSERKAEMQRIAAEFQSTVGAIVDSVSATAGQLETAAKMLNGTAENAERLSSSVAAASEQASANVRSVASATEQMTSSVNEIASRVQESSSIAAQAVQQAGRTDARIGELSQAASRIGDVVKLITAIAEQTNLLALNATIEAARAGVAGKGFAVVAQEVKALAAQTAKATNEIGAQIGGIQTATGDSVVAIKEIGATIARISEIAETVANAVHEQGAATGEIGRNIQQAAKGTAQVAANIGEVNRGAAETGQASAQVLSSAQLLANESNRLKGEVEKFLVTVRAA